MYMSHMKICGETDLAKWRAEQDATLTELKEKFDKLYLLLVAERNRASLATSLSDEILAEIFSYGEYGAIWTFAAVCKTWRVAALADPRLWKRITLGDTLIESYRHRFERSGTVPLTAHFFGWKPRTPIRKMGRSSSLALYEPEEGSHHTYWRDMKKVDKRLPTPAQLARIQSICHISNEELNKFAQSMAEVRSLHVDMASAQQIDSSFNCFPHLGHLRLSNAQKALENPSSAAFVTKDLTTLHFSSLDNPLFALRILGNFKRLEELSISGATNVIWYPRPDSMVFKRKNLPRSLRLLRLTNMIYEDAKVLFHQLMLYPNINLDMVGLRSNNSLAYGDFTPLEGECAAWITFSNHHAQATFDRKTSLLRLDVADFDPTMVSAPRIVHLSKVHSLYLSNVNHHQALDMRAFVGLKSLIIDFRIERRCMKVEKAGYIINEELARLASGLSYISIHLGRPEKGNDYFTSSSRDDGDDKCPHKHLEGGHTYHQDDANKSRTEKLMKMKSIGCPEALKCFLAEWTKLYGGRFPSIEVHDEIDPVRWEAFMPYYLSSVDSFVFARVSSSAVPPMFPDFRDFDEDGCGHCLNAQPNAINIEID